MGCEDPTARLLAMVWRRESWQYGGVLENELPSPLLLAWLMVMNFQSPTKNALGR